MRHSHDGGRTWHDHAPKDGLFSHDHRSGLHPTWRVSPAISNLDVTWEVRMPPTIRSPRMVRRRKRPIGQRP